jgi:hypothetical protein
MLPCACCSTLRDLPGALRALTVAVHQGWFFIEVSALAVAGLWAEIDRVIGRLREIVVCLDRVWIRTLLEQHLSFFHSMLLKLTDRVEANSISRGIHGVLFDRETSAVHPQAAPP